MKGCLSGCGVFVAVVLLASVVYICAVEDEPTENPGVEAEFAEYWIHWDRYVACQERAGWSPQLRREFAAIGDRLTEYELDPSSENRRKYLAHKSQVEAKLIACLEE